jgi:hypothetical protein
MATRALRDPAKEQFWRRTLQQWQHSGLSVRAFCLRQRLAEAGFYAWRRTLAQRDRVESPPSPPAFVAVNVVEQPQATPVAIEVVLGNGRVLRIGAGFDRDVLVRVVQALEGRPC